MQLEIPDKIVDGIKMPMNNIESELKKELAYALYERQFISMGLARELSGQNKWEFIEELGKRGVKRLYTEKELEEDINYASDM
ncbi:MAG: UPF0175 family protein [bacterium]|nr:UPF0175 family protein [bacterium]